MNILFVLLFVHITDTEIELPIEDILHHVNTTKGKQRKRGYDDLCSI